MRKLAALKFLLMNKRLLIFLLILPSVTRAQEEFLPGNINHTSKNNVIPAISGDGKSMIYLTDYSNTGDWALERTEYISGRWENSTELTALNPMQLNNRGGYFLDNSGEAIWFSSRKADGLGGYDIWVTKKGASGWGRANNPGKPLNSTLDEGDPSISPDGQSLYFMRCARINSTEAKECKIFVSEKNKGRGLPWKEPVALPDYINDGNTLSPKILSDNKTLIFSSDRPGGKGGLDLWMITLEGDRWSSPMNLEYANTPEDDRYISMSLRTDYAYLTRVSSSGFNGVAQIQVPEQYRPKDVVMLMGKVVNDLGNPESVDIRVNNQTNSVLEGRVISDEENGDFVAILTEGSSYEITFEDRSGKLAFQTQHINIEELRGSRREYPKVELTSVKSGNQFNLGGVVIDTITSTITSSSTYELVRLSRLLKQHPELKFNIGVYQQRYQEDSVQHAWLTELRYDSVLVRLPAIPIDSMLNTEKDSLLSVMNDTLGATLADTLIAEQYQARMSGIDSVESWQKKVIYHNNRTPLYAQTLLQQLLTKGVSKEQIQIIGLGLIPERKVKQVVFINGVALIVSIE